MNTLDAIIAKVSARRERIAALVAAGSKPFSGASAHGWTLLVSRDPSKPAQWRVTRFEGAEPVGHTETVTFEAACKAFVDLGGNLVAPPGGLTAG